MNEESVRKEWLKDPDADYWLVWNPRALSFWWCKIKLEDIKWLKGGNALQLPLTRRTRRDPGLNIDFNLRGDEINE